MIFTVEQFCNHVSRNLNGFIKRVSEETRVSSDFEKQMLAESYKEVSVMLKAAMNINPSVGSVVISTANIALEYKLPSASAWCDLVLLGKKGSQHQVLIVELKNWASNSTDLPSDIEGLINHNGKIEQHPADQARGYAEYCRRFHSAVKEYNAKVDGCVFFSSNIDLTPYRYDANEDLTKEYPVFNTATAEQLAGYFTDRIEEGDNEFATCFINGYYCQDRNILNQVAMNLSNSAIRPFVLLDKQREGFYKTMAVLMDRVNDRQKEVIIVQGPPGSGKSAVAINLWVEAVKLFSHHGNIVYVTTSSSQKRNWMQTFREYGRRLNAENLIIPANQFNPGMNGANMKGKFYHLFKDIDEKYAHPTAELRLVYDYYEDYTNIMVEKGWAKGYKDNLHFLSVVDEAHALINPMAKKFSAANKSGWCLQMGPQAYHIIRESQVSIFFTDSEQSFRDNETTSVDDIKELASRLGARVTEISLEGMQFRCAGSKEYVDWASSLLSYHPLRNHDTWKENFDVKVFDYPSELENCLRYHHDNGKSVRLLSSYSVPWKSAELLDINHLTSCEYDFDILDKDGRRYRKYWNYSESERYDVYVQGIPGSRMYEDPLSEVGCPYVVRGFDYDYVGLLWLKDVVRRGDKWYVSIKNTYEKAMSSTKKSALEEQKELKRRGLAHHGVRMGDIDLVPIYDNGRNPDTFKLFEAIGKAYRILLTRGVRGIYIYIQDKETREYVKSLL